MTTFLGSLIVTSNHCPVFIAGARFFWSGVILLTFYAMRYKHTMLTQLPNLLCVPFFKYAICLYTISAIGFSWGMQYIDPVKACFVFVLAPFITAVLLYILKGEQLSARKLQGLILGFLAVIPIILESGHGQFNHISWYLAFLGYAVFAFAVGFFAYGWILKQEMHAVVDLPSALITGAALLVGGGVSLCFFYLTSGMSTVHMQLTPDFYWLLLLFSILTAFSYNLYSDLLGRYSATFVAFASFLEPAFGLLYGVIFLGRSMSMIAMISLLVLGCGLYLFYQEELRE